MFKNIFIGILMAIFLTASCRPEESRNSVKANMEKEIYLAGGCFWGTEHYLKMINGVIKTEVGYANGYVENPTYQQVCTHTTGFAETVHVTYNPEEIPLGLLIEFYFKAINPTSKFRQGGDTGPQYRTGIYYTDSTDLAEIQKEIEKIAAQYDKPIVTEVKPLRNFYRAEEYHQDYLDKNPGGYCHISPDLFEFAKKANRKDK